MQKKPKGSILIVDDEKKVLKSLSVWLKCEGFETHTASGSDDALHIIENKDIDVTLLDYRLNNGDGISLGKKLLELDEILKIIILTGFPSYESAVLAMKSGVFDYLSKSTPNKKIMEILKNAVKERRADLMVKKKNILERHVIKIILFCDHSIIRERVERISNSSPKFRLVKSFSGIDQIKLLPVSREIDIALICTGCCMKTFKDSYLILPEIYRCFPGINPVIFNENFTDKEKVELLKLGVRGFSSLNLSSDSLEKALITIKKGDVWVNRAVTELPLGNTMDLYSGRQPGKQISLLTEREIEILKTMALGLKNREIGERLFISEKTVKTHVNRIFKKLGVNTRTKAIITAIEKKVFPAIQAEQSDLN